VVLVKLKPEPPKQPPRIPRPLVEVASVPDSVARVLVRGFGTVRAKRSIEVVPQVSGEIISKADDFEPGAFFAAGDVLLRIDDTDYVLAVERAEAEVARARYNLATAEEEAEVARREWDQLRSSGSSADDFATAPNPLVFREPQLALARADLAAAEAALQQARVNLDRCTLRAPFAGRTLSAEADQGQYVRMGTPIGSIYATDVAEIVVSVPDADLAWITVPSSPDDGGTGAVVDIQADFAGAVHHWEGRAVRLGGAVDRQSRQVPVVVEVAEPYRRVGDRPPLVEGMFVEAVFAGEAPTGSVAIPREALRPDSVVWVVQPDETIAVRKVQVARAGVEQAIITGGLAPGEEVCTSNLQYVTDGMLVRVAGRAVAGADTTEPAAGVTEDRATGGSADGGEVVAEGETP
jgi:RND family efflux transporter MFP subunit